MKETDKIVEAVPTGIFDGISEEELQIRRTATARVLDIAKKAHEVAERAGNTDLADKLSKKIDTLQGLLDGAEVGELTSGKDDGEETGGDGTKSKKTSSDKPGDDSEKSDSKDDKDGADTDGEAKKSTKPDSDKDSDKDSGKGSESDEDTKSETDKGSDKSGDEKKDGTDTSGGTDEDDWENVEVKGGGEGKESENNTDSESSKSSKDKEVYSSGVTGKGKGEDEAGADDGRESDDDSSDDDSSEDDKGKRELNPFEKRMPPPGKGGSTAKNPTHEEIFAAAKKILSKLSGEAKHGAFDGTKKILSGRGYSESLLEALGKSLAEMSEDEFNTELASTMELADQVIDIAYSDDLESRVTEIKRLAGSAMARLELEKEDAIHTKKTKDALKAYEKETEKYNNLKKMAGLDAFKASLFRAIRDQVIESEDDEETWAALNRRYEDDPEVVKKGSRMEDVLDDEGIPTINVYFDQSGSWSDPEIAIGKQAISVINEYHKKGDIKLQLFYTSAGGVFTTAEAARPFGGAEGWADALKHIRESGVKNVIVVSDSDLDHFEWSNRPTGNNGKTVIDGCVWWLWKNGRYSAKALKELVGKRGNYQFSFSCR